MIAIMMLGAAILTASIPDSSRLADIGPAPETVLTDAYGEEPFRLSGLASEGKAAVVSFIYTTCNGSCPATTHNLYRVQEALMDAGLWGEAVAFVSITLDPKTDTPAVLRRYAAIYGVDEANWHFLTGTPEQVAEVVDAWGMWARIGPTGTLDHPSRIFLVDPSGRQREIYNLQFLDPDQVVADVLDVLANPASD